jgi:hypothetical protein
MFSFNPLAVEKHARLMAARAEAAGLAREREEIIVSARVAVDLRKAVARIKKGDTGDGHQILKRQRLLVPSRLSILRKLAAGSARARSTR